MAEDSYNEFVDQLLAKTGRNLESTIPILQGIQHQSKPRSKRSKA